MRLDGQHRLAPLRRDLERATQRRRLRRLLRLVLRREPPHPRPGYVVGRWWER